MGKKLVIGPFNRGLRNDVTAFNIDNDSFPTLINAYQWRGRVKRKRGTAFLNRLRRFFDSTNISYNPSLTTIILDGTSSGNLITGFGINTISPDASITPGFVSINDTTSGNIFTDPNSDGILVGAPAGTGIINYATGAFTLTSGAAPGNVITAHFNYFPDLPVMGLEELVLNADQFPGTLAFDTVYSYNILTADPYDIYDVSFYKNPDTDVTNLPGYVPKTNETPTTWNGQDYQQFWTVNYQGALWATNGINVPFAVSNIGMQFKPIQVVTVLAAIPPSNATVNLQINGHGLVVGDFIFVNEVQTTKGINFQTGYVITIVDANHVIVDFPFATITTNGGPGIAQYLTNRSDPTKDCLRFYDGDPTNGDPDLPVLSGHRGWVNFAPPLSEGVFSIADKPARIYYLVGARMIIPFKDRLLFFGAVIQASTGNPLYLQDTVVYSQNGTPYYTASYTNTPNAAIDTPTSTTNDFHSILLPDNQTATPSAYFGDQTGFGGFITAGVSQPILTASPNEDVLIVGFENIQTKLVFSGNDIVPFNFFITNSEYGSGSTFSIINMDKGVLTRGTRAFLIANQVGAQRIDLEIPDEVFAIKLIDNGAERVTAIRDFINEWAFFTYPSNLFTTRFNTQTLQYNYRDNSWAIFRETYTSYGYFRATTGFIWATVGRFYPTWNDWNDPWNAGTSTLLKPEVIAGNQQGFIVFKDKGTNESNILFIQSFSGNTVTSPDHCLNNGDFIQISGCLGTVSSQVNNKIFSVFNVGPDTFQLDPSIGVAGTYSGSGVIKRMYVPFIQSKQFPTSWDIARKTRLGPQQYLFTTTPAGQIQLLIFLSQNDSTPYNDGPIFPSLSSVNDALIYKTNIFTSTESTNLGLTPSNINLNLVTAQQQQQTWHRMNTSLLGDTVQIGITLSDEQMMSLDIVGASIAITGASQASPCVLNCTGAFAVNQLLKIIGVKGMTQLNFDAGQNNYYNVLSSTATQVTIDVDSTGFDAYTSGGFATPVSPLKQFSEIELHGIILDVNPSQILA